MRGGRRFARFAVLTLTAILLIPLFPPTASAHWLYCSSGAKIKHSSASTTYWYPGSWGGKHGSATYDSATNMTNNTEFNWVLTSQSNSEFDWHKDNYGDTGWDGYYSISYTADCFIYDGDLYYNTHYTSNYTESKIQSVGIHEHGHGAGMRHFTDDCTLNSIMQANTPCRWGKKGINTVQTHDKDDINTTY